MSLMMSDCLTDGGDVTEQEQTCDGSASEESGDSGRAEEV